LEVPLPSRISLFLLACVLVAASPAAASHVVTLEEGSLLVEGLTPDGRAVVFTLGKPPGQLMPVTSRLDAMVRADAAGAATLELPAPIAARSVWVVVDVESGEVALASPEGFPLRQVEFPGRGVGLSRRFLLDERRFLDVLLVRPAAAVPAGQDVAAESGAWGRSFGDGGEGDGDGELDGKIEAVLERLRPIGDSATLPPDELTPGDVIVAVDPVTLEIYARTLAF
jgi:hypothetical protein